jgi:hypothetical protein
MYSTRGVQGFYLVSASCRRASEALTCNHVTEKFCGTHNVNPAKPWSGYLLYHSVATLKNSDIVNKS